MSDGRRNVDPFEEFVLSIEEMVQLTSPHLSHDSDWPPAIAAGNTADPREDGRFPLYIAQLPGEALNDEVAKDIVAEHLIPMFVRKANADMAAFLSTAWVVRAEDQEESDKRREGFERFHKEHGRAPNDYEEMRTVGILPPSEDPERREAVMIIAMTKGRRECLSTGVITRSEDSPMIESFNRDFIDPEGEQGDMLSSAGRFSNALKFALGDEPYEADPYLMKIVEGLITNAEDKLGPRPTQPWKD